MKSFFKISLTAFVVALFFGALTVMQTNAQAGNPLPEILNRMDTHYKALKSFQSDVTREMYNPQIDERDVTTGKISLIPGKGRNFSLRLEWIKPENQIISVVNGQYVAYLPKIDRAYTGNSESKTLGDKGGNALKIMSMSKEDIKTNYNVQYLGQENVSGNTQTWHLKLTPKATANYKFAEIWVDGNGMPLQGKITQSNDNTDSVLLTNLKKNVSINGSIFKVALTKKTEIIKS